MCTVFPSFTGLSKEILSTDAVTTGALQCFCAEIAAAMSIQYINLPPIKLPYTFVSFGRTISVIIVLLSEDFLVSIILFLAKVRYLLSHDHRHCALLMDYYLCDAQ